MNEDDAVVVKWHRRLAAVTLGLFADRFRDPTREETRLRRIANQATSRAEELESDVRALQTQVNERDAIITVLNKTIEEQAKAFEAGQARWERFTATETRLKEEALARLRSLEQPQPR